MISGYVPVVLEIIRKLQAISDSFLYEMHILLALTWNMISLEGLLHIVFPGDLVQGSRTSLLEILHVHGLVFPKEGNRMLKTHRSPVMELGL